MTAALTRDQVRQVDRWAIEELGIPGVVLMENAGKNACEALLRRFPATAIKRYVIVAGRGNNGGDGLVIARHLVNKGCAVRVVLLADPSSLTGDAAIQLGIVRKMGIALEAASDAPSIERALHDLGPSDCIVDAILGTGFSGTVRSPLDRAIERINAAPKAGCAAIDVPSGLDCDAGTAAGAAVEADLTVTFVAEKIGFRQGSARRYCGEIVVADIGIVPIDLRGQ